MRNSLWTERPPTRRSAAASWARGSRRAALALLVAALAAVGCARRIPSTAEGANPAAVDSSDVVPLPAYVFLSVENRNSSDAIVWLEQADGRVTRLGLASGSRGTTLRFPGEYIAASARLYLRARLVGGRSTLRSEGFTVQPGQQIVWSLESSLRRSMVSVY